MVIKKFVGKNEEEATALAKKELGAGIVIMNVRPVKKSGLFSVFRAPKVEVTVALEEDTSGHRSITPQNEHDEMLSAEKMSGGTHKSETDDLTARLADSYRDEKIKEDIIAQARNATGLKASLGAGGDTGMPSTAGIARAASAGKIPPLRVAGGTGMTADVAAKGISANADNAGVHIDLATPETDKDVPAPNAQQLLAGSGIAKAAAVQEKNAVNTIEEKLDTLHNLLEQRIVPGPQKSGIDKVKAEPEEKTTERAEVSVLTDALKGQKLTEEEIKAQEEALSFIRLLYNTLLENEVDEIYANELTDEVSKVAKPGIPLDHALVGVYQKMVLKFGHQEIISPAIDGGPKAVIFIGPTGVGKTTTIAKLASKLHLQDKKKVALLTVDTYRIAAAEQLRTYATIMETPFRVIYSLEEMKQAIDDFKDYDYIMVDTAGHSIHNEEQKTNIVNFIKVLSEDMESENYLVLSATTKYRDLVEITDAYSAICKYKLIFTKMDETLATGNLYNIRMRTGAPMSYITNGQDVPDDIEVFNAQKIVKVLLGGNTG